MKLKQYLNTLALLGIALNFQSCAPVFSEMQSARTAGKDNIEATATYSFNKQTVTKHPYSQNQIGFQASYGVSSRFDFRVRFEHIWSNNELIYFDEGIGKLKTGFMKASIFGIAPKYSLTKNLVAFTMPIGRAYGEYIEKNWQIQPTFLFTIPAIKNQFEINFAPKGIFSLVQGQGDYLANNVGIALSKDLTKWALRLEFGYAMELSSYDKFNQFGFGFSYVFSTK